MPMYNYKCAKCGLAAEVIRRLAEYDAPPGHDLQDAVDPVCTETEDNTHEWERQLSLPQVVIPHHHQAVNN